MPTEPKKKPSAVLDDPAEIIEGLDRELIQGPIGEIVEFFGMGNRVTSALHELGCQNGPDLLTMDPNKALSVASEKTARRIRLLFEFIGLKKTQQQGGIADSSPKM